MKVTVCSTITYHYDVDLPDWMCEKDEDGRLTHEPLFLDACYKADPNNSVTITGEWTNSICSVWTEDGKEDLY